MTDKHPANRWRDRYHKAFKQPTGLNFMSGIESSTISSEERSYIIRMFIKYSGHTIDCRYLETWEEKDCNCGYNEVRHEITKILNTSL